jgi:hypothetical protein
MSAALFKSFHSKSKPGAFYITEIMWLGQVCLKFPLPPMPPHVPYGLRGLPSRLWPMGN